MDWPDVTQTVMQDLALDRHPIGLHYQDTRPDDAMSLKGESGCFVALLKKVEDKKAVIVSGDVGVKKPDGNILHLALAKLNVAPAETIYVGDSIVDYEAAMAAGIRPVIIRRPTLHRSAAIVERYAETDRFLEEQAAAGVLRIIDGLSELHSTLG